MGLIMVDFSRKHVFLVIVFFATKVKLCFFLKRLGN